MMKEETYTKEEWDTFIKVLKQVSRAPFDVPDVITMKGLIAKTYKSAKNQLRKENVKNLKKNDQEIIQQTERVKNIDAISDIININNADFIETLNSTKVCYSCNSHYKKVHFFYHRLCPQCAVLSYEKRNQRTDLTGRTVLITGARIKIGYHASLKFLRDGARVIAVSRFPVNTLLNYSKEPDFKIWKDRLQIFGLDLRNVTKVEEFIEYLNNNETSLDIIVNNAAQTIKRPLEYYSELLKVENNFQNYIKTEDKKLLANFSNQDSGSLLEIESKYPVIFSEKAFFPTGRLDEFNEQLDLRPENTWTTTLEKTDTFELIEVHIVNSIVPFIFASKLKNLMKKSKFKVKFIINVSSSEGQFSYPNKSIYHPHNNMSKASLNMLTRTSASDYARNNIFINSIDVGWVSSGNPFEKKQRLEEDGFVHPLDLIDAAARIYDPIVQGINGKIEYGKFFKNYREVNW